MNPQQHIKILLDSFCHYVGRELITRISLEADLMTVASSPFVLVSHGIEKDPIFNYANNSALRLWEMDFQTFTSLPSRQSAEPAERLMRNNLLDETKKKGFYDQYEGIRISAKGNRFKITEVIVWNLFDQNNKYHGQAATFEKITYLP